MHRLFTLAIVLVPAAASLADDWPQWRGPNRDCVWHETGIVEKFAEKTLRPKWKVPVGAGYTGPTVADGRVFVMDRITSPEKEGVRCFDEQTGQKVWEFDYPCRYGKIGYQAGPRAS